MTRTGRVTRIVLAAIAGIIVLIVATVGVAVLRFNPNTYKPRIIAAVRQATGRTLALNGPISLRPSLWPTIQMENVALSNPPGFSRPDMATLQRLDLQVALLPLLSHRIQIDRLILVKPDIALEVNKAGATNWELVPSTRAAASGQAGTGAGVGGTTRGTPVGKTAAGGTTVSVGAIRINDGTLTYRDDRTGVARTLDLPQLDLTSASVNAPLHVVAQARYDGMPFSVVADTGSLARLQDVAATSPWPVKLKVTSAGATLTAEGTMTRPLSGAGYTLAVTADVPYAPGLGALLPGVTVPPLHDVRLAAKLADHGGAMPDVSAITLHVGPSDLNTVVPGLSLDHFDVAAAGPDEPVKANASAHLGKEPVGFAATTGPLAALLPHAKAGAPFPVTARLVEGGATLSMNGTIADPRAFRGAHLSVSGMVPDLAALAPQARRALPAIHNIAFQAVVEDGRGGFRDGVMVRGLRLSTADGDLSGDATLMLGQRDSLTATLASKRLDLDTLMAAIGGNGPATGGAGQGGAAKTAGGKAASGSGGRTPGGRLFSDRPLPFGLLRAADADIRLAAEDVRSGGEDYRAIQAHAVLRNGDLTVNPLSANLPGGHLSGTIVVNAGAANAGGRAPAVHVTLLAPGLALQTLLKALHEPSYANGKLEIYADLRGTGDSPHALAGTLDGYLGLAMANGTIDNRLLNSLLGKVMETLNALNLVRSSGTSQLQCFAARMDAQHGVGTFRTLALRSSLLTMTGSGSINLGPETVAMTLEPHGRAAGTEVVIPVDVTGALRDPAVRVNQAGAAGSNLGAVAGAVLGQKSPLGIVGGLLGGNGAAQTAASSDICGPALAIARGQKVPVAAPAPARPATRPAAPGSAPPAPPAPPNPANLLKNLFR